MRQMVMAFLLVVALGLVYMIGYPLYVAYQVSQEPIEVVEPLSQ